MWVKVSIAALVIALLGGAMYYLDNEEALTKERRECASRYKNLNGLRGEFTEEKTKYVDFLVKNEALTNDINALTKEKDELEVKITSMELLPDVKEKLISKITILIPLSVLNQALVTELAALMKGNPGTTELYFKVSDPDSKTVVDMISRPVKLSVGRELISYLNDRPELEFRIN